MTTSSAWEPSVLRAAALFPAVTTFCGSAQMSSLRSVRCQPLSSSG